MLKYLDLLIGLSAIMLLGSMIVSFIMQWISDLLNRRGARLLQGLTALLQQCDPRLTTEVAGRISRAVLTHPQIRGFRGRVGSVVQREELVKLLLELASPQSPHLDPSDRAALAEVLARSGISDPARALENIRAIAVRLESSNPELATFTRNQVAILKEAAGTFVNRVMSLFDGTIDRISHVFQTEMRLWGILVGFIVAAGLQLDTFRLVNELAVDDQLRAALVREVASRVESRTESQTESGTESSQPTLRLEDLQRLTGSRLLTPPSGDWLRDWQWNKVPGILVTAVLFSLGAPFWFGALKNLLRLRPALASKDDQDRAERAATQSTPPPQASPGAESPAVIVSTPGGAAVEVISPKGPAEG